MSFRSIVRKANIAGSLFACRSSSFPKYFSSEKTRRLEPQQATDLLVIHELEGAIFNLHLSPHVLYVVCVNIYKRVLFHFL